MPDSPALCGNLASCAAITSLGPRGQKPAFTTFEQAPAATGGPTAGAGWLTGQQRVGKLETAHGRDSSRAVRRREGGTSRRHLALNDSASRRAQPSDTYKSDYLPCITLARDGRMGSTREPLSRSTNRQMAHVAPRKWLSSWSLLTFPWKARKIAWSDRRDKHATGKALAQIVGNGIISTTGSNWGTREKSRASAKGASVGRVYREVSFNYFVNQR